MNVRSVAAIVAITQAACFSVHRLPPPAPPPQVVPAIDHGGPPAPGLGRILIDVDGESATVTEVQGATIEAGAGGRALTGSFEVSRTLCTTPCKVDLQPGPHTLRFVSTTSSARVGTGYVNIDQGISAYRYTLGRNRRPYGRRTLAWITGAAGVFCDVGAIATIRNDNTAMPISYGVLGVALTGLSWWLFRTSGFVEQNGAGVQWTLPSGAP